MEIVALWDNGAYVVLPLADWKDYDGLVKQFGLPDTIRVRTGDETADYKK